MLKLKKLQILGFKSFCDRTEMQFPGTGIVGIVGPNGCGKSNVADAISWVLGEQSAKLLRGGRMEDVIFAGTRDRAATGMAEVSLTLIDPAEYDLAAAANEPEEAEESPEPVDDGWDENLEPSVSETAAEPEAAAASAGAVVLTIRKRRKFHARNRRGEVMVTRRLYRNGESEYLMNGRPCRLRDIQEIFLGTGLGPESYAIIEQGRVGQILSSKPYDRRAIIEEAAGVSKYKAKRRLAEARLEASRLNLARINDIFEEVTRQVGSLKRQSAKAQRYRQYKVEFDGLQRRLVRGRAEALAAAGAHARSEQAAAQAAVRTAQQGVEALEAERTERVNRCAQLERDLRQMTETAGRLQRERDHAQQQIEFQGQQAEELRRRGEANQQEWQQADQQSRALAAELEQAARDQDEAGERLAAAQARHGERRAALAAAQAAAAGIERERDAARRQGREILERAARLGNQITQGEAMRAELDRRLERLGREEAEIQAEMTAGGARRGQLALEFQSQESEAQLLAGQVAELERRTAELGAALAAERQEEQRGRTQAAEVGARRRSLEEITAQHGYSSEAVKRLFARRAESAAFQPLGVLGEFVEVEAPYDRVLEQFLHDELNYVVVGSWDQAGAGVGLLRTQEQGRATFLVHGEEADPTAQTDADEAARAALETAPGLVPLLGEVRALNGFRHGLGAILPKLRDAYWLADAAQARALSDRHPRAYFLTPQGECFHNFTVSGGAGQSSGPLSLKRELRDLTHRESELQAEVARREQNLVLLARQTEVTQAELEQARTRRHELEKRLLTSGQAVQQLEHELERSQARLRQAQVEGERARAEHRQVSERLEAARAGQAEVEAERVRCETREAEAEAAVAGAREETETAAQAFSEAQSEAARIEERACAATASADRLRRLRDELSQRLRQMLAEGEALEARRHDLLAASQEGARRVEQWSAELTAASQGQAAHEAALSEAQAAAQRQEESLRLCRQELDACRQALGEWEVALARLEAEGEHLCQTCRDDLGCELEALLAAPAETEEAAPEADVAALEAAVRELRQRIENLGPVNMMALEEYEEAQQRHAFMEAQRKDLLDSIADTQKAIQEMDTISRQKFQEAFERINEYFQESFRALFGGGQGLLRLSEIEGAAESGVDIVAQPPGKKLQNALLLSGGEKAMTAMALLLAVFRYQPSPFCLLDEVDAPMDEANVVRFSQMVKQMSAQTQFILITHNKRTMEVAPRLYGVTMSQPGVSRLVSVMMEEERQAAAS